MPPPPLYAYLLAIAPRSFPSNRSVVSDIFDDADAGVAMLGVDVVEADATPTRRRRDAIVTVLLLPPPPAEPRRCNTQQPLNSNAPPESPYANAAPPFQPHFIHLIVVF